MLDSNPSYVDVCDQPEEMGLKLDRALFAKSLLAAAPPPTQSSSASSLSTSNITPLPSHFGPAQPKYGLGYGDAATQTSPSTSLTRSTKGTRSELLATPLLGRRGDTRGFQSFCFV
ncbi:uncharacterized protein BDZ99DRAFT_190495 [Mytilinidion resinicola]|uniref:Uncharacterized protein n=1 Tax=Mytilinidion resinicola TaxID=574789 RepID=A0A6A6Z2Z2_9PEZI|nr:uncharacterized protein BDZ99DRAFT_190495 [Mytilinidion resinicola]KAF2815099.1 hypothetical protein BDZ99DRAFT_190495 [Mytilinidion resinicola]